MHIGMIVQRYGEGVDGGAEAHCRQVAERLARNHEVTVLTSCAQDYLSWADHFPPGPGELNGVKLLRFPVSKRRKVRWFNYFAQKLYDGPHSIEDEWSFLERQGPHLPGLMEHLLNQADGYGAFVFFTYLYYPTAVGLPLVSYKSILVPTAHEEPPLHLAVFRPLFHLPRHILYNTESERDLVHATFNNQRVPSDVVGVGFEEPGPGDPEGFKQRHGLEGPYLLYLGRIDVFKGCGEMFRNFMQFKKDKPGLAGLKLVLVGREHMEVPEHPDIISLGFVPEEERDSALRGCSALVMPSPHESLSMVTMEAALCGKPVLVTQKCDVLKQFVQISGGGLLYGGYDEFRDQVASLLGQPGLAASLGEKGKQYVSQTYNWPRVMRKYEEVLGKVVEQVNEEQG
jgi:glycosyltransferase involved in cell wall biosynthesis